MSPKINISEEELERMAYEKFPKDSSIMGGCSGVREYDKYSFDRKNWIEGFKDALAYFNKLDS